MACTLSSTLYKAPPRNPCLEANHPGCNSQTSSDAAISSRAHRCIEQTSFSYGACLMQPCESLRPVPPLPQLEALAKPCQEAEPQDALLCSFLNLQDYTLYYQAYDATTGVQDCWDGLRQSLAPNPKLYDSLRVWEQIGYTSSGLADRALQAYDENYRNTIQDSSAGAL